MSKKAQREMQEKKEQDSAERERRFSSTLAEWMQTFVEYYKENPPSDSAMLLYKSTLEHLSPEALAIGCKEAVKRCDHIPRAKDILEAYRSTFGNPETAPSQVTKCSLCGGSGWKMLDGEKFAVPCRDHITPRELSVEESERIRRKALAELKKIGSKIPPKARA